MLQFSPIHHAVIFTPPSPIYCPVGYSGQISSTQYNEADDILWGESSCQCGPLEPTYCVFAEAAVEQNAVLGSISHTSREQDEALFCEHSSLNAQVHRLYPLSHTHTHTHTHIHTDKEEFIGDDKVKGCREEEKERKWDHLLAWTLWFRSKCALLCLPCSAVDCDLELRTFLLWDALINFSSVARKNMCATSICNNIDLKIIPVGSFADWCKAN